MSPPLGGAVWKNISIRWVRSKVIWNEDCQSYALQLDSFSLVSDGYSLCLFLSCWCGREEKERSSLVLLVSVFYLHACIMEEQSHLPQSCSYLFSLRGRNTSTLTPDKPCILFPLSDKSYFQQPCKPKCKICSNSNIPSWAPAVTTLRKPVICCNTNWKK